MNTIDLRSDTVTRPTEAMRRAMMDAPLGDDVYAEDPTVNRLQDMLAERSGKEAALFFPSGTMSNQAAIAVHVGRCREVIVPEGAHVYEYEPGSMALISAASPRFVAAPLGVPTAESIRKVIRSNIHQARTGLISLENTHNKAGGTVMSLDRAQEIAALAQEFSLPLHLDGARAWNAMVVLESSLETLCQPFDSVSLCLSKGLAAPIGSVLVGSRDFIQEAHRYRKTLGGGMRQVGILAAAGIVAVESMVERLAEDHAKAQTLAKRLNAHDNITIDMASVQTNLVYAKVAYAEALVEKLAAQGVLCNALSADKIRLVTHLDVSEADIAKAGEIILQAVEA